MKQQHMLVSLEWLMLMKTLPHNFQDYVHNQNARRPSILDTSSDPVSDVENMTRLQSKESGSARKRTKMHGSGQG